jgi:hypothetical protein
VAPAATVAATTVAQTPEAQAAAAQAARATPEAYYNQGSQQDALSLIRQAATGQGPSAAQAQYQKALDQAIYAQRSIASSAHGHGRIAAAIAAGQNIARITGQSAADSAAPEGPGAAGGQAQYLAGTGTARGQDVTLGLGNAQLANQVNLQNASLGTNVNLANQSTGLQTNLTQAQIAAQAAAQNAAATNTGQLTQAQINQQSALANQQNALDVDKTNQAVGLQTAMANAGFTQGANLANQSTALEQEKANQAAALQTSLANAGFQQQGQRRQCLQRPHRGPGEPDRGAPDGAHQRGAVQHSEPLERQCRKPAQPDRGPDGGEHRAVERGPGEHHRPRQRREHHQRRQGERRSRAEPGHHRRPEAGQFGHPGPPGAVAGAPDGRREGQECPDAAADSGGHQVGRS